MWKILIQTKQKTKIFRLLRLEIAVAKIFACFHNSKSPLQAQIVDDFIFFSNYYLWWKGGGGRKKGAHAQNSAHKKLLMRELRGDPENEREKLFILTMKFKRSFLNASNEQIMLIWAGERVRKKFKEVHMLFAANKKWVNCATRTKNTVVKVGRKFHRTDIEKLLWDGTKMDRGRESEIESCRVAKLSVKFFYFGIRRGVCCWGKLRKINMRVGSSRNVQLVYLFSTVSNMSDWICS